MALAEAPTQIAKYTQISGPAEEGVSGTVENNIILTAEGTIGDFPKPPKSINVRVVAPQPNPGDPHFERRMAETRLHGQFYTLALGEPFVLQQ